MTGGDIAAERTKAPMAQLRGIPLTKRYFSRVNCHPHISLAPEPPAYWVVWEAASERESSKCLARLLSGGCLGPILELTEIGCICGSPCSITVGGETEFYWLTRQDGRWEIRARTLADDRLSRSRRVTQLPRGAKPGRLQATAGGEYAVWLAWAQMSRGAGTVEVAACKSSGIIASASIRAGTPYNFRPRIAGLHDGAAYLVWDAYRDYTYDVWGCRLSLDGPSEPLRISRDAQWENKACLARSPSGQLAAVWVRWQDVEWNNLIMQQMFTVRGATLAGDKWQMLPGGETAEDILSLNYGLLSEPPDQCVLGHQGNRLQPIARWSPDGTLWVLYEMKAGKWRATNTSVGRLAAVRLQNERWSDPVEVTRGRVGYVLPEESLLSRDAPVIARDLRDDEHYLETIDVYGARPTIPPGELAVSVEGWETVDLIHSDEKKVRPKKGRLVGKEYTLFWADLHVHSALSTELEGNPDELALYARDKARIDALCISDNDVFWNHATRPTQIFMTDYEFDRGLGNAKVFDQPGRFVIFPGWEYTAARGPGYPHDHRTVFGSSDEMDYEIAFDNDELDLAGFIERAKAKGYYVLPHHGDWNWQEADAGCCADVISGSTRNLEDYDTLWRYLDAGHKFGFTGSSDNHFRNPGFGGALTGLWAKRLDRESILEALRARRCYATSGQRIVLEFTVNGRPMGSLLKSVRKPEIRWRVEAGSGEYTLRIIRGGKTTYEMTFQDASSGEWIDSDFAQVASRECYYFLEVASTTPIPRFPTNVAAARGAKAWSSPIWLEPIEK